MYLLKASSELLAFLFLSFSASYAGLTSLKPSSTMLSLIARSIVLYVLYID